MPFAQILEFFICLRFHCLQLCYEAHHLLFLRCERIVGKLNLTVQLVDLTLERMQGSLFHCFELVAKFLCGLSQLLLNSLVFRLILVI